MGKQRNDRTSTGPAVATTNDDRCGQSSTNSSYPNCPSAKGNLLDLRVGNKPETFVGETHEWRGSSFKMRQYVAAVDEELHLNS